MPEDNLREELVESIEGPFHDSAMDAAALLKRRRLAAGLAAVFLLAVLAVGLRMSRSRQNELRQQIQQQAEQMERQSQLIDALRVKQDAADSRKSIPVVTSDTLKSQLGAIQELVTQEYLYTNADRRTDNAKWLFGWTRPFSDSSLLVTYDGSIRAGIDLSEVRIEVDEENRKITVTLPASRVTDNNIPQETITVVEVKNGLFNEISFDDYNTFISEQKIIMANKAIERGLLEKADEEARKAVEAFLSALPAMEGEDAYTLEVR